MDFFDVVQARRSVRSFKRTPVERELERIFGGCPACAVRGRSPIISDRGHRGPGHQGGAGRGGFGPEFVAESPVVLVFCADARRNEGRYGRRGATLFCVQDATIAASYAQLAASAQGLASCWVGAFDETTAAAALRAPPGLRPVAILPIGWAAEEPQRPQRRPIDELVRRGRW